MDRTPQLDDRELLLTVISALSLISRIICAQGRVLAPSTIDVCVTDAKELLERVRHHLRSSASP